MDGSLRAFVKRRRAELGLTQLELAERAGVSQPLVSDIERGATKLPDADRRRKLAKALEVSHVQLLIAAGELAEDELKTAHVEGVVESDPDDLREILTTVVRQVHWREKPELAHSLITIVTGVLQDQDAAKRRRVGAGSAPGH